MKTFTLALTATVISATAAFAMGDIETFDANGDRFATIDELRAVHPDLTQSDFRMIDENRDNRVSATEIAAPQAQRALGRYEGAAGAVGLSAVDTSRDGFISPDELFAAYPGLTSADWNAIDLNNDRRINSTEFMKGNNIVVRYSGAMDNAILSLASIDADGSMFADFDEVMAAYPGLSGSDFRSIDSNDDNRLSFVELYRGQEVLARN